MGGEGPWPVVVCVDEGSDAGATDTCGVGEGCCSCWWQRLMQELVLQELVLQELVLQELVLQVAVAVALV